MLCSVLDPVVWGCIFAPSDLQLCPHIYTSIVPAAYSTTMADSEDAQDLTMMVQTLLGQMVSPCLPHYAPLTARLPCPAHICTHNVFLCMTYESYVVFVRDTTSVHSEYVGHVWSDVRWSSSSVTLSTLSDCVRPVVSTCVPCALQQDKFQGMSDKIVGKCRHESYYSRPA